METVTAKKKTRQSAADTIAKLRQTLLEIPQPKASNELQFIDLELIDCEQQIRTEFETESIEQLAKNIATQGVLQPILLRPALNGRYTIIAGERRYRAAKLIHLRAIPATITNADSRSASAMQLAENIQRENLSLKDTARAIAELYSELGNVQAVADRCHKSKAWVSKRLAFSAGLGSYASSLLNDGITEDVETLKAVSDLEKIAPSGTNMVWALCEKIRKGLAGRTEAREKLAEMKEELDPVKKAEREKERVQQNMAAEENRIRETEKLHKERQRQYLESLKTNTKKLLEHFELQPNEKIDEQLAGLDENSAAKVTHHLECLHSAGIGASLQRIMQVYSGAGYTTLEFAAYISGLNGHPFEMTEIVQAVKCTNSYTED